MSKKAIPWILAMITVGLLVMNLRSQPELASETVTNARAYQGGGRVESSAGVTPSTDALAEPLVAVVPNPTPVEIEDEDPEAVAARAAAEAARPQGTAAERRLLEEAAEEAQETVTYQEASDCAHPFVPSTVGDWRRYRWRQSNEADAAEMRLEVVDRRGHPAGWTEIQWRASVQGVQDERAIGRAEFATRCTPGERAEEPWFGILERSLGLRAVNAPGRWRWPPRLSADLRFNGTAVFDARQTSMQRPDGAQALTLRITRNHIVEGQEEVSVPAGRFETWRVGYEEEHAFGSRGESGHGRIWVAPDIGLVRQVAENADNIVQTIELLEYGRRTADEDVPTESTRPADPQTPDDSPMPR